MNEKTAKDLLPKMITVFQKFQANTKEAIGDDEVALGVLAEVLPYVFGEKSILHHLIRLDNLGRIEPMDFYNTCLMLHEFTPEIIVAGSSLGLDIPKPDTSWLTAQDWGGEK